MNDAVTAIEQLSQIDWRGFLITLAIIICSYFVIKELVEKFFKEIGYTPPWVVRREEQTKAITELKEQMEKSNKLIEKLDKRMEIFEKKTDNLEKHVSSYDENRVHDREQSVEIRNGIIAKTDDIEDFQKKLADGQDQISQSIGELKEQVSAMQKSTDERFEENDKKNKKRYRAELKDRISQAYRYYHAKGKINSMELEALEDLIEEYESADGVNSFVHSKVQPEMYTWILEDEPHWSL